MERGPQARRQASNIAGRSPWLRRLLVLGSVLVLLAVAAAGFVLWQVWQLKRDIPDVDHLSELRAEQPSVVLSADGRQLTQFKNIQREWIKLDQVSPWVIRALLATEDRRFYEHRGVDFKRTASAAWQTLQGDTQGGSTLTQQLARNLFPEEIGRSRNATRKVKEMLTALEIERTHSKDQILEIYLNTVPFLYNVFGIEMAARTYFASTASELGPLESATLVGMLKGTHYYNPVVNPERARTRRNTVLAQLAKTGELPQATVQRMTAQPLQLRFSRQEEPGYEPAMHYTEYVRRWLLDWADKNQVDLYTDGLVIHTTLDTGLQEMAIAAVDKQTKSLQAIADVEWSTPSGRVLSHSAAAYLKKQQQVQPFNYFWRSRDDLLQAFIRESPQYRRGVEAGNSPQAMMAALRADAKFMAQLQASKTRLEAGMVAMDPNTGEVKAWVGSRDFARDQFDHVAQALRQPGSTFKPMVYGAALERGFSPMRTYLDTRVNIRSAQGESWMPTDMGAPTEMPMTMREGLVMSRNSITAQVMQDVGLPDIVNLARASGITRSRLDAVPSLALGTSPVTLLEMVSAYSTIASVGQYREPLVVKRITDRRGKVLAQFGAEAKTAMTETTAVELIDMMRGVVSRGTGAEIRNRYAIQGDVAGKTGTTQFNTDGWFILMHPGLVTGAWVGFNDARVTMRSNYWGQGGHNALSLVGDFYKTLLKEKQIDAKARFPKPARAEMMAGGEPSRPWLRPGGSASGTEGALLVQRSGSGASGSSVISASGESVTVAGVDEPVDPVSAARAAARGAIDGGGSAER
ncbi:MAG: penicillin-binding protein [Paucimonas sp.]|nr:penicillin-binding protein [Paucimonas sp.]